MLGLGLDIFKRAEEGSLVQHKQCVQIKKNGDLLAEGKKCGGALFVEYRLVGDRETIFFVCGICSHAYNEEELKKIPSD